MATSFCDPTKKSSNAACNFPDPNVLDLRKGTNPQFLAHQANRVRFQRVAQLNKEIDECERTAASAHGRRPRTSTIQQITNQPTYGTDGTTRKATWTSSAVPHRLRHLDPPGPHEGQRAQHEVLPRHAEGREAVSAVHTVRGTESGRPTKGSGQKDKWFTV